MSSTVSHHGNTHAGPGTTAGRGRATEHCVTEHRVVGAGTLAAHELARMRSMLGATAGIALGLAALGILASHVTVLPVVSVIGAVTALFTGLALTPVVLVLLVVDYWRSAYGRTAYLTHLIPARGSTQYWVRLGLGVLALLASLVLGAAIVLATVRLGPEHVRRDAWEGGIAPALRSASESGLLWWFVGLVAAMFVVYLVQYFFVASIGSEQRLGRFGIGGPVLAWVVLYVVSQALMAAGVFALPFGVGPVYDAAGTHTGFEIVSVDWLGSATRGESPVAMPLGIPVVLLFVTAFCLVRTLHSWNHRGALR